MWTRLLMINYHNAEQILPLHQNFITAKKHPRSSLCGGCFSLIFRINVLRHFVAIFSESKPLNRLQNRNGLFLCSYSGLGSDSGSGSSASATPHCFEFNKTFEHMFLIMGVQQLEVIFPILRTNLRAWLFMCGMGANDAT